MLFRSPYDKQLDAIFLWLSSVAIESDRVFVDIPGKHGMYRFKSPLTVGDYPQRIIPKALEPATFAIVNDKKFLEQKKDWASLFFLQEFSVYERKTRSARPLLRLGMSMAERALLLHLARRTLEAHFSVREDAPSDFSQEFQERFQECLDVDVALWVRGKLRGSMIATDKPLCDGVIDAARRSTRDLRFKPISKEDLPELRIEITVFSPLRIPLTKQLLTKGRILPEKGYCLKFGNKTGWFLPEVFNVQQFANLSDLLHMLARKKTGLSRVDKNTLAHTVIFDVEDFVEPAVGTAKDPIALSASMPRSALLGTSDYLQSARDGAEWLCRLQEEDGNIPPGIDFSKVTQKEKVDWSRLGFASLALHEFGSFSGEARFCSAAEKALGYIEYTFFAEPLSRKIADSSQYASPYAGQLAIRLERSELARRIADSVVSPGISEPTFHPIFFAQRARFLGKLPDSEYKAAYGNLLCILRTRFLKEDKENPVFDFASWASAVEAFWDIDRTFALEIAKWITARQHPDGSFPTSPTNSKPYTRGTGKIAEVLALDPARREEVERALSWLCSMQYSADTMFFVPPESRNIISGSLRHDYLNWESWTDSVAHFLIAISRFCQKKP